MPQPLGKRTDPIGVLMRRSRKLWRRLTRYKKPKRLITSSAVAAPKAAIAQVYRGPPPSAAWLEALEAASASGDDIAIRATLEMVPQESKSDPRWLRAAQNPLGRHGRVWHQVKVWARIFASAPPVEAEMDRAMRLLGRSIALPEKPWLADGAAGNLVIEAILKEALAFPESLPRWTKITFRAASLIAEQARTPFSKIVIAAAGPTARTRDLMQIHADWPPFGVAWLIAIYGQKRRAGKLGDAETLVTAACEAQPDNGRYFYRLIDTRLKRGRLEQALEVLAQPRAELLNTNEWIQIFSRPGFDGPKVRLLCKARSPEFLARTYMAAKAAGLDPKIVQRIGSRLSRRTDQRLVATYLTVAIQDAPTSGALSWVEMATWWDALRPGLGQRLAAWQASRSRTINQELAAASELAGASLASASVSARREIEAIDTALTFRAVYALADFCGDRPPVSPEAADNDFEDGVLLTFAPLTPAFSERWWPRFQKLDAIRFGDLSPEERLEGGNTALSDVTFGLNSDEDFGSARLAEKAAKFVTASMFSKSERDQEFVTEVLQLAIEDRLYPGVNAAMKVADYISRRKPKVIVVLVPEVQHLLALSIAAFLEARGANNIRLIFDVQLYRNRHALVRAWPSTTPCLRNFVLQLALNRLGPGPAAAMKTARLRKPVDSTTRTEGKRILIPTSLADGNYFTSLAALYPHIAKVGQVLVYNRSNRGAERLVAATPISRKAIFDATPTDQDASVETWNASRHLIRLLLNKWGGSEEEVLALANAARLVLTVPAALAHELSQFAYLGDILRTQGVGLVLTLPGRMVAARALTLAAREYGVGTVDVQAVFMTPHPRYRAALSDVYCGLTDDQLAFYREKHPAASQRIERVGSLMIADQLGRIKDLERGDARANLQIEGDRPFILFAAQHGLGREADDAAVMITEAANAVENSLLIIKAHPRTSQDALDRMSQQAARVAKGEVRVIKEGNIYAMMKASDLVVTQFSNVGLEAAVIGLPVISINTSGRDYAVDLVPMGVAVRATSVSDLTDKVRALLGRGPEAEAHRLSQMSFFQRNPELLDMSAPAGIAAIAKDLMRTSRRARAGRA